MGKPLLVIWLAFMPLFLAAQISNLRSKALPILTNPQLIDTLIVLPNTVEVTDMATGERIFPPKFSVASNRISFDSSLLLSSNFVAVKYRVAPYQLVAPLFRIDTGLLAQNPGDRLIGVPYNPFEEEERPLLPQQGLDYNGNYTRGLSFGNNQNLVLNSQFNLQMAGNLGDVEVLAAISDNNIPIQPEGNTQQLREFDKVFIQISKDQNKLIAGDYELGRPNSYFMNYFKKLQGATFSRPFAVRGKKPAVIDTRASIAIARGKFARNAIAAQEGNQGPYRLEGAEGERFIIVLSGTEKIYVDGKLMQRGLDADYVIDYNAGHITFTNRRLITKDSRIVAEFDYNVQNYQRSLYVLNAEYRRDDLRLYLNTYSEQDGRQPIDGEFSSVEMEALRNAGDNSLSAVVSAIDTVQEFSAFRVLYELKDTTVNGILYENVLVFSTDRERAKYSAGFSLAGAGNGNYVLDTETPANGRVYRWVAPDPATGLPSGEYEPVRRLVAPNRQQLYTTGAEWNLSDKTRLRAETALSSIDQNRLSPVNDGDNLGLAATAGLFHIFEFGKKNKKEGESADRKQAPWRLETEANYEFTQQKFKELNPYRPTEFTRDWNINQGVNDVSAGQRESDEQLANGGFVLRSPGMGNLQYNFSGFFRDSLYTGIKHLAKYAFQKNGYDIWAQGDFLSAKGAVERSRFLRPKFNAAIPFLRDSTGTGFWRAGVYGEQEKNSRYAQNFQSGEGDTLNPTSFRYDLVRFYLESPENEKISFKTNYQRRLDYAPDGEDFTASALADELNLNGNWQQSRNSRLGWNFTWRQLSIRDASLTTLTPSDTYLGRLDYTLNLWHGAFQSATSYEIGAGQERKVEFTYLQVPAGEGTHQWTDRNGDGKVQFDEVEIAPFQDVANAVRVTVFTDDFIRTNNVVFNQSLRLEPKALWFNANGVKKFLSKFSTQNALQTTRKVRPTEGVSAWNPFQLDIADTALVSVRSSVYNTLFFNRSHPKYDFQLGMSENQNKLVQTNGFEGRRQQEQFFKVRWNLTRTISFQSSFSTGEDEQDSEQFENRRYRIRSYETKPQLSFQPSTVFRTGLTWRFRRAENRLKPDGENAQTHDLKWDMTFNQSATTSIRSEFSLVNIKFEGQANSPVGFAFLQGLQNGKNYIWNIALDRQVAKNIRLGISYEGRKTGTARMVHVGRAQASAVF